MKPNGFPKEEKLKNKTDISLLFEQGKWFSYKELAIISLQKENLPTRKVGVSVSKKFFKKAVDRNREKLLTECAQVLDYITKLKKSAK